MVQLWSIVWRFFWKLEVELPYLSNYLTSGHILRKKNHNLKKYMHCIVHCSTIHTSQKMKATETSINRGMDKGEMCVCVCVCVYAHIHTYYGILVSHSKELNNTICSNMEEPRDFHTEWSKSDRQRQTWCNLYVETKKMGTKEFTKQK